MLYNLFGYVKNRINILSDLVSTGILNWALKVFPRLKLSYQRTHSKVCEFSCSNLIFENSLGLVLGILHFYCLITSYKCCDLRCDLPTIYHASLFIFDSTYFST